MSTHAVERKPDECHHCRVCEAPPFMEDGVVYHLYERGTTATCEADRGVPTTSRAPKEG